MKRTATATWAGTLTRGSGQLTTPSRVLAGTPISFATRFGGEMGTNAEELIAAAHASCYTMTLTYLLGIAGTPPERIETEAEVTVARDGAGWTVTGIHLRVAAEVPGASTAAVREAAQQAKTGCLVSRLVNVPVTLDLIETASAAADRPVPIAAD
jgi:osmotically inducible protein OsmC